MKLVMFRPKADGKKARAGALLGARRKKLCYNFRQNLKGSHPILKKGSKGNGSASLLLVGLRPLSPFLEWGHCSIPA